MKVSWQETARVPDATLTAYQASLASYAKTLKSVWQGGSYNVPEAFINLPFDGVLLKNVNDAASKLRTGSLRFVLVVGIGGSNLGTRALYDALYGYADALEPDRVPHCIFIDTFDATYFEKVSTVLQTVTSAEEIAVVIVSKSGTTTETVAGAALIYQTLRQKFPDLAARTAVISDADSPLQVLAVSEGMTALTIPKPVGGRFSVFSAAGLLPLALLGVDLEAFRQGAAEVVSGAFDGTDRSGEEVACVLAYAHDNGYRIHDLFMFAPRLESLGKWYRQLLAESIGKEKLVGGLLARVGLTPTVSIGTTDLHSVAQLTFAGPREKITTFVSVSGSSEGERLHSTSSFISLAPMIAERSVSEMLQATLKGVGQAYATRELPYIMCVFDGVTPHELGAFMQYSMLHVMYLGVLLSVNAFDQPAVDAYKEKTRRLLTS